MRDHHRSSTVISELEMGAAGEAVPILGDRAEDAEADAANEADVDDAAMAKAGSSKVDVDACREY